MLDEGNIVELDHPYKLLQDKDGYFYKMVQQTGKEEHEHLLEIARGTYTAKHAEVKGAGDEHKPNGDVKNVSDVQLQVDEDRSRTDVEKEDRSRTATVEEDISENLIEDNDDPTQKLLNDPSSSSIQDSLTAPSSDTKAERIHDTDKGRDEEDEKVGLLKSDGESKKSKPQDDDKDDSGDERSHLLDNDAKSD